MAQNVTSITIEGAAREIMALMPSERVAPMNRLRAIILNRREGAIANVSRAILAEVEHQMDVEAEGWEAARLRNTRVDFVEEMAREILG